MSYSVQETTVVSIFEIFFTFPECILIPLLPEIVVIFYFGVYHCHGGLHSDYLGFMGLKGL